MGLDAYWRYQRIADVILACALTGLVIKAPSYGYIALIVKCTTIPESAKEAFSASFGLFGLVAATVAFVFSAMEGEEFKIVRQGKARKQMWAIFSFTLFCLLVSAGWSFILMIQSPEHICTTHVIAINTFISMLVAILLLKFTWVIASIIAIKAAS